MKDIEIARSVKLDKITDIANRIGIMENEIEQYGNYKAKLDNEAIANRLREKNSCTKGAFFGASIWHKRRSNWWRIFTGSTYGRYKFTF